MLLPKTFQPIVAKVSQVDSNMAKEVRSRVRGSMNAIKPISTNIMPTTLLRALVPASPAASGAAAAASANVTMAHI